MAKLNRFQRIINLYIGSAIHNIWMLKLDDPIFIVGCPRSGTTILGEILSKHPKWIYLNEPRYIWRFNRQDLNIWGDGAYGQLTMGVNDFSKRDEQFSKWFHFSKTLACKKRLVEKMPLNVFRIRWLNMIFPNAKFIHIIRNGCDVAQSLEKAIPSWEGFRGIDKPLDRWLKTWNYKMFLDYANKYDSLRSISNNIQNYQIGYYSHTLFVWLCCVHAGIEASECLPKIRIIKVKYENLINQPDQELRGIFSGLDEPIPEIILEFADNILHTTSINKYDPYPEITKIIAGEMLNRLGYIENV